MNDAVKFRNLNTSASIPAPDDSVPEAKSLSAGGPPSDASVPVPDVQLTGSDTPPISTGPMHIQINFDPTKTKNRFFRAGPAFLLKHLYFLGLPLNPDEGQNQLNTLLENVMIENDACLKTSSMLEDLNLDDENDAAQAYERVIGNQDTAEWWATLSGSFVGIARDALKANDVRLGMWAISMMQNARSMLIFKQHIERNMWLGYTTSLMSSVLDIWEKHKNETSEEFWQKTLTSNTLILSQLFAFPVVVLKGKAYLGGKGLENTGGKLVDFFLTNKISENAAIVEIKTPKTKLLEESEYRFGVFGISRELTGAVNQSLVYKDTLARDYLNLRYNSDTAFYTFNPQCLVIAGNAGEEIVTKEQRKSFELFRSTMKDVHIVTYDELFAKLEALLGLLGV